MDPGGLIQVITVGATATAALIAVTGVTVRLVFAPVLKAKRQAAMAPPNPPDTARVDARMDALEEEVRRLADTLDRVVTTVEFDQQLHSGAPSPRPLPPE